VGAWGVWVEGVRRSGVGVWFDWEKCEEEEDGGV